MNNTYYQVLTKEVFETHRYLNPQQEFTPDEAKKVVGSFKVNAKAVGKYDVIAFTDPMTLVTKYIDEYYWVRVSIRKYIKADQLDGLLLCLKHLNEKKL